MKILMVCLGNICRSPLADGLMRQKIKTQQLDWEVDSAGTASYHIGASPDARTQENAKSHNVDLSFLKARQFVKADFDRFDRIYAMDESNYKNILSLASTKEDEDKVTKILDLLSDEPLSDVPDPYYGGEKGFEHVYQLLDRATDQIIENLK